MRTLDQIDNELSNLEEKLTKVKGRDTEVYTRIVGYHRSVSNWNRGKREEFKDRLTFKFQRDKISEKLANIPEQQEVKSENESSVSSENVAFYKFFQSQTCRNCPPVKEFMKKISIPGEDVDVSTDLGLTSARKYNVMSTPTVILFDENDHVIDMIHTVDELKKLFTVEKIKAGV
jgi:hypothetical protein